MSVPQEAQKVLDYWFRELEPGQWFGDGRKLDSAIRGRFAGLLERARRGEFARWTAEPRGRLALILLLDQFSRHIHRGKAEAFASDEHAEKLSREAIALGEDLKLNTAERHFLYMPLMHAESESAQDLSLQCFENLRKEAEEVMSFAVAHREQIERFGRFPYRNPALGRTSTPEEAQYIASGKGNFG